MEDWVPWVVFPALLGLAFVSANRTHRGRVRALRALAAGLEAGEADAAAGFFGTLPECRLSGRLQGRAVAVSFEGRGAGGGRHTVALPSLDVAHPAATFEVEEAGLLDRLGRWLGRGGGGADDPARAREGQAAGLLQATEVRDALRRLLELPGVTKVALTQGALTAEVRVGDDLAGQLRLVLDAMAALARPCDRVPFAAQVAARADALAARFAWTGGTAAARCPYCKDDLSAEADVAGCERCQTVHHRGCLAEAGGCTVFGCGARDGAGRARA